ncbi:NapC/NirT family cytochrome c [Aeromonas hydrophila]|uniref:NapC/NirT family cytochrome c n=1 Tax=Aeromonas hydrophila TaxID=644 RepID=UPI0022AE53A7|nr:NapC/NirT family cytochrome c [Aeromonas hydrophila]MCZ4335669.1 NapC/NirT family cytochrome c [Aeromonas hydrophila]
MKIKKRIIAALLMLGVVFGWLSLGGGHALLSATSSTEFCLSCHSMEAPYKEYQGSVHFSNSKGIRAECADCHIPSQPLDYLLTKIRASKDIYHEFVTDKIDSHEKYEQHRGEMAETVWAQFRTNDSATCRSCHNQSAMETYDQSHDAQKMHQYGMANNQTCIDCHRGVAHLLPEVKLDSKAHEQLARQAQQTTADSREVFPAQVITMGGLGTINPATSLTVLASEGDNRKVQLNGFQLEGAEQVLYLAKGQRAIVAMLSEEGQKAVTAGTYEADEYGNKWRSATLVAQIDQPVLASREPLWSYAKQLDNVYCSTCHAKIPSHHFTLNAWPAVAKGMGDRTSISKDDLEILTKYFQYNAKDFATH